MSEDVDCTGGGSGRVGSAAIFLVLMVLIGSSTATAAKFAVHELPPGLLPLLRFGVAGLCLLPLAMRGRALMDLLRDSPGRLLAAAVLCVPINQAFFLYGTRLAPTTHVGLIYATCPLVVLALATALGQERLDSGRIVGILVTVAGAAVIAAGAFLRSDAGPFVLWGDLLLFGAVASWGAYLTVNKPLVARHGSLAVLTGTFLLGCLIDLPIALLTTPIDTAALRSASTAAWLGTAHLALIVTVFGLACQNQALRQLDASQVATVGNAAPLLTIVWGTWLLGERITPTLVLGGVLVLGGILWTTRPRGLVPATRRSGLSSQPFAPAATCGEPCVDAA